MTVGVPGVRAAAAVAVLALAAGCGLTLPDAEPPLARTGWRPSPGSVHEIKGLRGAEDIVVDPRTGTAYISARDWHNDAPGALYTLACDAREAHPLEIPPQSMPHGFYPHGIDLVADGDEAILMVVNHVEGRDASGKEAQGLPEESVEMIRLRNGKVVGMERHTEGLHAANDLVALGPRSFIATNPAVGVPVALATLFGLKMGTLQHVDRDRGGPAMTIAEDLPFPNGIARGRDGRIIVATMGDGGVRDYQWDPNDRRLHGERRTSTGFGTDNLTVAVEGGAEVVWVAGHPDFVRFLWDTIAKTATAPSRIARMDMAAGRGTLILDETSGGTATSSVAAVQSCPGGPRRLLIGSVYDDRVGIVENLPSAFPPARP